MEIKNCKAKNSALLFLHNAPAEKVGKGLVMKWGM